MSKFKFFHGKQRPENQINENQINENQLVRNFRIQPFRTITVEYILTVTVPQSFRVPIDLDYDLNGLSAVEAYNRLIDDFSTPNLSVLEYAIVGLDDCTEVVFSNFKCFRQTYYQENGMITSNEFEIE
jgi:hypothetical protein